MKTVNDLKSLSLATGAALVLSLASGTVLAADSNPFGMTKLTEGYQVAMKEGKCGGDKAKAAEGKCGGDKAKKAEGKCGEGKCGGDKAKKAEGKCGEGKCGGEKAKQ